MKSKIGIDKTDLSKSIKHLEIILSSEMVLYVKTRSFHWNVSGNSFMELHKMFESQYIVLEKSIDEIAERIGKLGSNTIGTMAEFIKHSVIKENAKPVSQQNMIAELLADHESIIKQLRVFIKDIEDSDDYGSVDFATSLILSHEEQAWILRRYIS